MCSIWGSFSSLASILDFQHCTDEAQKAETVLSAVSYLDIYIFFFRRLICLLLTISIVTFY